MVAPDDIESGTLLTTSTPVTASWSSKDEKEIKPPRKANSHVKSDDLKEASTPTPIPLATLMEWKRLDLAEEEARRRGGWGKLSYDEFEAIYKSQDSDSNRLDYLGSWIDFCIP